MTYQSDIVCGISSGILSGIVSGVLSGILCDILCDILWCTLRCPRVAVDFVAQPVTGPPLVHAAHYCRLSHILGMSYPWENHFRLGIWQDFVS